MAEGGVVDEDVFLGDALADQIGLEDVVRGARIDVIGAQQCKLGDAQFVQIVIHRRDRLLVRRGTGVEHVLRRFLALVLHRVEQQAVQFLDHRQHRLARHRGPAAEHHVHLGYRQQLARLFREQRPVRRRIDHDRLKLLAQEAALGVLGLDQHQHGVFQRGLRDGHRARKRMQDADLDRFTCGKGDAGQDKRGDPGCQECASVQSHVNSLSGCSRCPSPGGK